MTAKTDLKTKHFLFPFRHEPAGHADRIEAIAMTVDRAGGTFIIYSMLIKSPVLMQISFSKPYSRKRIFMQSHTA